MGANHKLARVCAGALLQEFGADCGQRLPEIAPRLGLEIVQIEADKYDGALLRIQGAHVGTIVINSRIREAGRRKFTLAHEIGHYLLPNQQDLVEPCSADSIETGAYLQARESESEANSFAAEVLMPREQMVDELRMTPCFQAVRSIAAKFGVSLTAAICRLVEFSTFRIAVVQSRDGRVDWYKPSEEFGRAVQLGPLHPSTYASDWFRGVDLPDRPCEVPAEAWLYDTNLRQGATAIEHSVALPYYNVVLSLLLLSERIESRTEFDDDDEDRSLDPQEFTLARKRWKRD